MRSLLVRVVVGYKPLGIRTRIGTELISLCGGSMVPAAGYAAWAI